MQFFQFILALAASTTVVVAFPNILTGRASCSTPGGPGTCILSSTCTGTILPGLCSSGNATQCCVPKVAPKTCTTAQGKGICQSTATPCTGGTYVPGACPGGSSNQCCVKGAPGGGGGTGLAAFDISEAASTSFWTCAAAKFKKVIIRGYSQSCSTGGAVDKNLLASYKAAKAAGLTNIDVYMFPCTGTQPTGVACKSPATQISELETFVTSNTMSVGHLWFDVEPASGACNAWNLGSTANEALAKQWTALLRKSSFKWGIYGNGNQWSSMFASRNTDIGSDFPLWAVQDDFKPGVSTVKTFMGGWTTAFAKQFNLDTTACGSSVDLDSIVS